MGRRTAVLASLLLVACGSRGDDHVTPTDAGGDAGGDAHVPTDAGLDAPVSMLDIVSVEIVPPGATLASTDGSMPTQDFDVVAHLRDGSTATPAGASWTRAMTDVGDVDAASGVFTATGLAGGVAMVHVDVPGTSGTVGADAMVTVTVSRTVMGPGVPADAPTRFPSTIAPGPTGATILYPLEGAVMPKNVAPADVQWQNGASGDLFRVTLATTHTSAVGYLAYGAGFQDDWLVDAAAWRTVASSDPGEDVAITVDRFVAASGTAVGSPPVHVRFANGVVLGSIYYWDLGAGESIRVDDGTGMGVHYMPSPPGTTATGHGCIGCHAISHSGRFLSAETGDFQGVVFDLTTDLTPRPAPTVYPTSAAPAWFWSSFSPDDSRIVADNGSLRLFDPHTGASIAPASGALPSANASQPAWAPNGSGIAYAANIDSGYGNVDFTRADIGVVPVTGRDAFGTPVIIHSGTSLSTAVPPGTSDNYPTWSPDSQWIAFAHGTGYRGDTDRDALYLVAATGGATTRLDHACGGATTDNNYIPSFSPFDNGGYFWITFQSTRDYGNALAGTRGTSRPQVWVAAISDHPTPGTDPSEVAYWLPGQDVHEQNIEAFWARHACRRTGDACSVSSECCSLECRDDGSGSTVCVTPPPERCHGFGETCSDDSDCCPGVGLVCQANVCITLLH